MNQMCTQQKSTKDVSIIMPTYNRADTLPRAVQSVLDQSHQHFELIIVDDGSDDNTEQVVQSFKDSRVQYVQSEHKGASAARNCAIARSKCDYIAFLDSDDQWHPDFLLTLLEYLINADPKVGVVFCSYWYYSKSSKIYKPENCVFTQGNILPELLKGNFVALPAAIIKKECILKSHGFDETLPCRHDWELWIRIAMQWEFQYIDKPLLNVYRMDSSISTNHQHMIEGWAPLIRKHITLFSKYPDILSCHYLKIARSMWYPANPGIFRDFKYYTLNAFKMNPKHIKGNVHLLLASILGYTLYSKYQQLKIKYKSQT